VESTYEQQSKNQQRMDLFRYLMVPLLALLLVLLLPVSIVAFLKSRRGGRWERLSISGIFASVSAVITAILLENFDRVVDLCSDTIQSNLSQLGLSVLSPLVTDAFWLSLMFMAASVGGWFGWWLAHRSKRKNDETV
jgi:hypothetical protein